MDYIKSVRLSQWIKNFLIFVSFFASSSFSFNDFSNLFYIFVSFSLVVSSTYIFNDFKDIDADINHPTKCNRAIASGRISKKNGFTFMLFLFILGNAFLYYFDNRLLFFSFLYTFITISYSQKLKYIKYFDILTVSLLFVLRIMLGSFAISVSTSIPLILFVFFISLGITTGKKLSILKNDLIKDSKVKDFLARSYGEENLQNILKLSLQLSLITYIVWVIVVKSLFLNSLSSVFLTISCVSLFFFIYTFIENSFRGLTEEIIENVKSDKSIKYLALIFGFSVLIGVVA